METAAKLLSDERKHVADWHLRPRGFRALAPGLEKSVRATLRAKEQCLAAPSFDRYHTWRRRLKTLWLQVRLLELRCGAGLVADRERLELLDGVLGECHDCALLQNVLRSGAPLPRHEAAHCIRVLRRHQAKLRARAHELGRQIHDEKPRRFVRRVRRVWQVQKRRTPHALPEGTSWLPAA
jgi:CHAD domain-containing protein